MILEKIKDIMEEELGKDRNEVTLESDIIKDLGLDSLDIVRISILRHKIFRCSGVEISVLLKGIRILKYLLVSGLCLLIIYLVDRAFGNAVDHAEDQT